MTRKDFVGFGILGTICGAILTIPPAAFVLGSNIDVDARGQTDVPEDWYFVGSIADVGEEEPGYFRVEFPVDQTWSQKESKEVGKTEAVIESAIWTSWKTEIIEGGLYGAVQRPSFLDDYDGGEISEDEAQEAQDALNVLSSSCAHLGCPVRWIQREGEGEFLCPCHGGIYNINGAYVAGPPPRDMYSYVSEVRTDGNIYVRHEYDVGGGINEQAPYVV